VEVRQAERKTYKEEVMVEWEADRKKRKPTSRRGRPRGKPTEKKWRQAW
jgi:hypothetical protein